MFMDDRLESAAAGAFTRVSVDKAEVEREAVIAMLDRERRSLPASVIGLGMLAVGVAMMPNLLPMTLLLALRLASYIYTRMAVSRLEYLIRTRQPAKGARRVMTFAMCLTGITLGLMLWPPPPEASVVAVNLIRGVVIVTATLVAVTLAGLPQARDGMLACFWLTTIAFFVVHPNMQHPALLGILALIVVGIRIYSANTGLHIRSAAQMLVENRQLSEDLADALAHAEFLSWRDPLTGLYNRRKLFEETRIERSPLSRHLLTIDLDRFKAINDTFGHGVGDHVLIAAADTIREWCSRLSGSGDHQGFRLGGEEFLVLTRGLTETQVSDAAEALRESLAAIGKQFADHDGLNVSASIGVAAWRFSEPLDDALLRSDEACYAAKDSGRNQVRRAV